MSSDQLVAAGTTARMRVYSLLDAIRLRRSRRFAPGMTLNGGPLA